MGPERLDRARTVESIAAITASGRPPWAGAVLVRYPPRAVGLAAGAAVCLPGAPAGGHGELLFPAVDSAGRSVGAGRRNRPCVAGIGIVPARGHPAWRGLQRRLPCAGRIQLVEAPIPLPGNNPVMVPTTVAAIPSLPLPAIPPSPRAVHPLHTMIAGHAAGQKPGPGDHLHHPLAVRSGVPG